MEAISISKDNYKKLCHYIEKNCGLSLGDEKDFLVESRLSELIMQEGFGSFKDFYEKAENNPRSGLCDKIVSIMKPPESKWFMDKSHFTLLKEKIFPLFEAAGKSKIRIWSMSCAAGQEPYSIAITIQEFCGRSGKLTPGIFSITATDIYPSSIYQATNGKYDVFDMCKGLDIDIRAKYFKRNKDLYTINNEIKEMVDFQNLHLKSNFDALKKFDIIFCRFAVMNYSNDFKEQLYGKIYNSLNPEGILFSENPKHFLKR